MRNIATFMSALNIIALIHLVYMQLKYAGLGIGGDLALCAIAGFIIFIMGIINIIMHIVLSLKCSKKALDFKFPRDVFYLSYCGTYYICDSSFLTILLTILSSFTLNILGFIIMPLIFLNLEKS